jgi:hypothetical protein
MTKQFVWALALIIGVGIGVAAVRRSSNLNGWQQDGSDKQANLNAAFRDGAYTGKQDAQSGHAFHVATGRWTSVADRASYAAAYNMAFNEGTEQNGPTFSGKDGVAAFRDGLYLGKLDSDRGNERHVAAGRWSKDVARASFTEGYNRGYETGSTAQMGRATRQASLVR